MKRMVMKIVILSVACFSSVFVSGLASAAKPKCTAKEVRLHSVISECACPANHRIIQNNGVLACEEEQLSYRPSGCSVVTQAKDASGCRCDRPLSEGEANEIYEFNGVDAPVSVYSYVLSKSQDSCDRVEWFYVGNLVQCGADAKSIIADVSKSFQVLDSEVKKGEYASLGACGAPSNHLLWLKIYSRDRSGVSKLLEAK